MFEKRKQELQYKAAEAYRVLCGDHDDELHGKKLFPVFARSRWAVIDTIATTLIDFAHTHNTRLIPPLCFLIAQYCEDMGCDGLRSGNGLSCAVQFKK